MNTENFAKQHSWVPIEKVNIQIQLRKTSSPVIKKKPQFSLILAWECQLHKVQALGLSKQQSLHKLCENTVCH